jgi:hypothetical protein
MWRAWRVQLDGTVWMIVICPRPVNESGLKAILYKQFEESRIGKTLPVGSLWSHCQRAKPHQHRF